MDTEDGGWLLVATKGVWERLLDRGAWAFGERTRKRAERIVPGDVAAVFLSQHGADRESALAGLVEFRSPLVRTTAQSGFHRMYPWTISFDPLRVPPKPVPFKPLVPHLSFLPDGEHWGGALGGRPLKRMRPRDMRVLAHAVRGPERAVRRRLPEL